MGAERKANAIYHVVRAKEDFETAATALVQAVAQVSAQFPGRPRAFYLDIESHRNAAGGDADMYELQVQFVTGFLLPCSREAHLPLLQGEVVRNPQPRATISRRSCT